MTFEGGVKDGKVEMVEDRDIDLLPDIISARHPLTLQEYANLIIDDRTAHEPPCDIYERKGLHYIFIKTINQRSNSNISCRKDRYLWGDRTMAKAPL